MLNAAIKRKVIQRAHLTAIKQAEARTSCIRSSKLNYVTSQSHNGKTYKNFKNENRQLKNSGINIKNNVFGSTNRISRKFSLSLARYDYVDDEMERTQRMGHIVEKSSEHLCSLLDDIIAGKEIGEKNVNTARCNAVIRALHEEGTEEALICSEQILEKMEKIGKLIGDGYSSGRLTAVPDFHSYWSHVDYYLQKGDVNNIEKAYSILKRMENDVHCDVEIPRLYDAFHKKIIFANPDSGDKFHRADICERAFMEMKEPTTKILNCVLRSWVKSSNKIALERAENLLHLISEWSMTKEQYFECQPDLISFNTVLTAYSEKGQGDKAQLMYDLMEELYAEGELNEKPNFVSHLSLLSIFGGKHYISKNPTKDAFKAEKMLNKLIQTCEEDDANGDLKPQLFVLAIKAWGKCRNEKGVEKASGIIKKMKDLGVKENTYVYNAYLETIAKSNIENAHLKTAHVLKNMMEQSKNLKLRVKPDFVSYTSHIKAILSSSNDGAQHAMNTIKQLESDYANGISNIKPNDYMYSTLLSIFKREPTGRNMAEDLLLHMENRFKEGHTDAKPTLSCYRTVLESLVLSAKPNKGEKSYDILLKCEKNTENECLFISDYNLVLETCATVKTKEKNIQKKNLSIVLETYNKILLSPHLEPSSESYYFLLIACTRFISDASRQKKTIEQFLHHCKKNGLLSGGNKKYSDLSKSWTHKIGTNDKTIQFGKMSKRKAPYKRR